MQEKINEEMKETIHQKVDEVSESISKILLEIEDVRPSFENFYKENEINTYFPWTIDERLHESKVRLNMALTRLEEFKQEANGLNLSESGFY